MRYLLIALVLFVSVEPMDHARRFETDDAAADSLWAYRDRFAASATNMALKMGAMSRAAADQPSVEYRYLDKANDTFLKASLLLTWDCDIMRMQRAMCEPERSQYESIVMDRLQRTRSTLSTLQSLLIADVNRADRETKTEILARNQDIDAAENAIDSILQRAQQGSSSGTQRSAD
jgi:hypothetical protein